MISIQAGILCLNFVILVRMLFDDKYKTITQPSEGIFRDKGSKFIAYALPIRSDNEVRELVSQLKNEHPKARHHCWAYRLTPDRSFYRINDDGEPSGTAGRPILNAILSKDLTYILVVVVRYFGGTLLGVPGLINAYKTATTEALLNAEITELTVNDIYSAEFEYIQMNDIMKVIKDYQMVILSQNFETTCRLEVSVPKSLVNTVVPKLEKCSILKYIRTI